MPEERKEAKAEFCRRGLPQLIPERRARCSSRVTSILSEPSATQTTSSYDRNAPWKLSNQGRHIGEFILRAELLRAENEAGLQSSQERLDFYIDWKKIVRSDLSEQKSRLETPRGVLLCGPDEKEKRKRKKKKEG
uniref:Uncharacterized protein n=1 Tax=Vespula pensylvanica TaxID=30213 RepID=A0A834PGR4_VESPE|nr:hypothetical protein H0235_001800 [Vespula pensylvanica]